MIHLLVNLVITAVLGIVSYFILQYLLKWLNGLKVSSTNSTNMESFAIIDVPKLEYFQKLYSNFKQSKFEYISNGGTIDNIDRIYVITMPSRRDYVLKQMKELGLNFVIFDAVKPDDLSTTDYSTLTNINDTKSKIFNKKTRVGCAFSHLFCYLDAITNNYKNIIVFEDDIKINVNLPILKNGISEFLKSDFKLFYMGYCFLNCNQQFNKFDYKYITNVPNRNLLCAHSIAIKVEAIVPFLANIFPFTYDFDEVLRDYIVNEKVKVCIPYDPFFIQNSTLGTTNENYQNLSELKYCVIK
jgi:GR25 family glycosyltransferase involved in LPS biosynthesis